VVGGRGPFQRRPAAAGYSSPPPGAWTVGPPRRERPEEK
jgi:hypothetical protein